MAETFVCSDSEKGRRAPPEINAFRPFVTEELKRRKINYPFPTQTPFLRLTSCLESPTLKYKYFSLGLHGFNDVSVNIFDAAYGGDREIVGYAVREGSVVLIDASELAVKDFASLESQRAIEEQQRISLQEEAQRIREGQQTFNIAARGTHPVPGLMKADIQRYEMGAGMVANVTWQCYNRQQLEFLRHHFLTAGTPVVLEWGHQFSDTGPDKILNFSDENIEYILAKALVKGRKYLVKEFCCPNNGNYDFLVGKIGNFKVEFEAETNTYKCTTTIHSSGENLWGLKIADTIVNPETDIVENRLKSFEQYFQVNGPFDKYLETTSNENVSRYFMNFTEEEATNNSEYRDLSTNPNDYRFITWRAFFSDVMNDMLNTIFTDNPRISDYIHSVLDFQKEQLTLPNDDPNKLWVGYNPHLKSTNPEVLLLIKPDTLPPPEFLVGENKYFGPTSGDADRASLNSGVWLNSHMIRECFLGATSLEQALRSILIKMNNAVIGYWDLRIYYDEETSSFKVIDYKFTGLKELLSLDNPIYRFNVGTTGECLSLGFDSAFPPEVVTQLALVAQLESNPAELDKVIQKYPSFAQSTHYAFAMNWTDLKSTLTKQIDTEIGRDATIPSTTPPPKSAVPVSSGEAEVDSNTGRVTGNVNENLAATLKTTITTPEPGEQPDDVPIVTEEANPPATADQVRVRPRNTVLPPPSTTAVRINNAARQWEGLIRREAARLPNKFPNLDKEALIKALIWQESRFNAGAFRREQHLDRHYRDTQVASYGFFQILNTTAYDVSRGGHVSETDSLRLFSPSNNFKYGTDYLIEQMRASPDLETALARYNGGGGMRRYPPGANRFNTTAPCLVRNADGTCKERAPVIPGQFPNQAYVNNILFNYSQLISSAEGLEAISRPEENTRQQTLERVQHDVVQPNKETTPEEQATQDYTFKFGGGIVTLVEVNRTKMRAKIVTHGIQNHRNTKLSNAFLAPFPTTAKIEVQLVGVSGISIFDGFLVDKLPYIYERYGIFHTVQMREQIDSGGWRTSLTGIYRFLMFAPAMGNDILTEPPREPLPVSNTPTSRNEFVGPRTGPEQGAVVLPGITVEG